MNKELESYIFTFGSCHALPRKFVKLLGTREASRQQMVRLFGSKWAFQYPASKQHELEARGLTEHTLIRGCLNYGSRKSGSNESTL